MRINTVSKIKSYALLGLLTFSLSVQAAPDNTALSVWANEAIVATYTYNYKNFLARQKEIAKYFTAEGWTAYSAALLASKLPESIQTNSYYVSAVATLPPQITLKAPNQWQAKMPLLVVYRNPQYQQKQNLEVTIDFKQAPSGQGVRGLSIISLQSKVTKAACKCQTEEESHTQLPEAPNNNTKM